MDSESFKEPACPSLKKSQKYKNATVFSRDKEAGKKHLQTWQHTENVLKMQSFTLSLDEDKKMHISMLPASISSSGTLLLNKQICTESEFQFSLKS